MGPTLCAGTEPALSSGIEAYQWLLEGGRDLHSGERQVDLPVPGRRLGRCYDRFPACRAAGCCCRHAILPERLACSWQPSPQGDQRRWQPVLSQGGGGTEAGGQTWSSVSLSYLSLVEQHRRTGSSSDQTTGQRQPGVPILTRGASNHPGI